MKYILWTVPPASGEHWIYTKKRAPNKIGKLIPDIHRWNKSYFSRYLRLSSGTSGHNAVPHRFAHDDHDDDGGRGGGNRLLQMTPGAELWWEQLRPMTVQWQLSNNVRIWVRQTDCNKSRCALMTTLSVGRSVGCNTDGMWVLSLVLWKCRLDKRWMNEILIQCDDGQRRIDHPVPCMWIRFVKLSMKWWWMYWGGSRYMVGGGTGTGDTLF